MSWCCVCTTPNDTGVKITFINHLIKGMQASKCNLLRAPNLWNVSNPLFNISIYVKGQPKFGVPTSVHNVNISSHLDASSVINVNVSLELNFIYIHV